MYCIDCKAEQLVNRHFIAATPSPQAPPLVVDSSPLLLPHIMFALLLFNIFYFFIYIYLRNNNID